MKAADQAFNSNKFVNGAEMTLVKLSEDRMRTIRPEDISDLLTVGSALHLRQLRSDEIDFFH